MSDPTGTLTLMPIEPPTEEQRDALRIDLLHRADAAQRDGWSDYESIWSSGEVAGTRAVLDPSAITAVCPDWAPKLWGIADAETDADAGYERTRAWFQSVAEDWRRPISWPPCPRPGWNALYQKMIAELRAVDPQITPQRDGVYACEGELTVLVKTSAAHFDVWPIMCDATRKSTKTCEVCGDQGTWREDPYRVRCELHEEKP